MIIQEVNLHPNSVITRIEKSFEKPSIIHIVSSEGLRGYSKPPIFDRKYLVIFDNIRVLESNLGYLKFDIMFPILHCETRSAVMDAKALLQDKGVKFSIYISPFEKEDAKALIYKLADTDLPDTFCTSLIKRVGLYPQRIVDAVRVCEQVGFSKQALTQYVDKYVYIDVYDLLETLLGISKSEAQRKRASLYLHLNRFWYTSFTRDNLVKEVGLVLELYEDWLSGEVTNYTIREYTEKKSVTRYRVLYVRDLLTRISLTELLSLQQFLSKASLLEVSMRLL